MIEEKDRARRFEVLLERTLSIRSVIAAEAAGKVLMTFLRVTVARHSCRYSVLLLALRRRTGYISTLSA